MIRMRDGDRGVGDLIDDKSSKSVKRTETIVSYFYSKILYRVSHEYWVWVFHKT